jgi:hypothetical protein
LTVFFDKDQGMVFFLAFLVLTTIVVPAVPVSRVGQLAISLVFVLTLIFGAFAAIRHRFWIYLVIGLAMSAITVDQIAESGRWLGLAPANTTLKLVCLSILVFVTLKRTLRPGPITGYRVIGGIAGYLLIGLTWTYGYQLLVQLLPAPLHFDAGIADAVSRQPSHLIYFSFVTLTTVGYGDVHPVHPIARSMAIAEALVGQLYLAILIASLVSMALHQRPALPDAEATTNQ